MKGIKKKFLDILFENDDDYVKEAEQETEEKPTTIRKKKTEGTIKAKEVLYRKPKTSAFIDLDEPAKPVKEEESKDGFEFSTQISPIFGMVNEKNKKTAVKQNADETMTVKPETSHLDTITSPIYGYGEQEEGNYIPPEKYSEITMEEAALYRNDVIREHSEDELQDLMEYIDSNGKGYPYQEEYSEEYPFDERSVQESSLQTQDEAYGDYDMPYYDDDVLSEDYDEEEINLFDGEEEE